MNDTEPKPENQNLDIGRGLTFPALTWIDPNKEPVDPTKYFKPVGNPINKAILERAIDHGQLKTLDNDHTGGAYKLKIRLPEWDSSLLLKGVVFERKPDYLRQFKVTKTDLYQLWFPRQAARLFHEHNEIMGYVKGLPITAGALTAGRDKIPAFRKIAKECKVDSSDIRFLLLKELYDNNLKTHRGRLMFAFFVKEGLDKNEALTGAHQVVQPRHEHKVSYPSPYNLDIKELVETAAVNTKVTPESPPLEQSPQYTIHPVSGEIVDFEVEFYDTRPSVNLPVLDIDITDDAFTIVNNAYAEQLTTAPILEIPVKE